MKGFKIRALVVLIIVVLAFAVTGCDEEKVQRDVVPKIVEQIVKDTQKAILERDVKLARETWSKVTEYSVMAKDHGDEELAQALSKLATTYVKLIEYCESGEEDYLKAFNANFAKALEKINSVETVVEKTQAVNKPVFAFSYLLY